MGRLREYCYNEINVNRKVYDEWTLIRFLRRGDFKVAATKVIFDNHLKWVEKENIDKILHNDFSRSTELAHKHYHHSFTGIDKLGRPINVERFKYFEAKPVIEMFNSDPSLWSNYFIREEENLLNVILPYCSKMAGRRIDTNLCICDIKGMDIRPLLGSECKPFLNVFIDIGTNHYPALFGQMYVVNAGWMFTFIWAMVKVWISEKTKNKVKIFGKNYKKELYKICDPSQLPEF